MSSVAPRHRRGHRAPGSTACVLLMTLVVLVAAVNGMMYTPLTFTARFTSTTAFCDFAVAQYWRRKLQEPIVVVGFTNVSALPSCGNISVWVPGSVSSTTTTVAVASTTEVPSSTTTTVPSTSTAVPTASSASPNGTSDAPVTNDSTTATPDTTTAAPATIAARWFGALNGNDTNASSTTTPASSTTPITTTQTPTSLAPTTSAPPNATNSSSSPNATSTTTTAPTTAAPPNYGLLVSFAMDDDAVPSMVSHLLSRENWLLSLSELSLSSQFGITSLSYEQVPGPPAPPTIAIDDPRANTTGLTQPSDYLFLLQSTLDFRYRLPTGTLLPWLMNQPSAGTIWQVLGTMLLGLSQTNADIDTAAFWFPMSWTSSQGDVIEVHTFNETEMYGQPMFPCTTAVVASQHGGGYEDGFNCWFRLRADATLEGTSVTPMGVLALLNAVSIRAEVTAYMGGGLTLHIVPKDRFPRRIRSFTTIADAAESEYSTEKTMFAIGLIIGFFVVMGGLVFLWVWTGSGRVMKEE